MSTVATVEAIAPEFVGDSRVQTFLDFAILTHSGAASFWANAYDQAVAFYVAHWLTTLPATAAAAAGLSGGAVTSLKTGGESIGYAAPSSTLDASDADLMQTTYGRKYLHLRSTRLSLSPSFVTMI